MRECHRRLNTIKSTVSGVNVGSFTLLEDYINYSQRLPSLFDQLRTQSYSWLPLVLDICPRRLFQVVRPVTPQYL